MYRSIALLLLFIPIFAKAQESQKRAGIFSGIIIYSARITLNKTTTSKDTLRFNRNNSIFIHQNHKKEKKTTKYSYRGKTTKFSIGAHDIIGEYNFYNTVNDSLYSRKYLLGKIYFLKAKSPDIQWNITDSTKKIGEFVCTEAKAHFRGRDYIAWFTPDIPVPYGPWKLIGLPGLILQAHDSNNNIYFKAEKLTFTHVHSLGPPPVNGNENIITLAQYKKILNNLRKTMAKKAEKIAREYAKKHHISSSAIHIKVQKPKLMEIFADSIKNKKM
jgi:GLPGLI family protein